MGVSWGRAWLTYEMYTYPLLAINVDTYTSIKSLATTLGFCNPSLLDAHNNWIIKKRMSSINYA